MNTDNCHGSANGRDIALLLAASFTMRVALAFAFPNIAKSDEVFQVVEPAYHWLYGGENIAWEWSVGMRSWVFPGFVAGLLALGRLIGLAPPYLGAPVTIFMVAASLSPIACAYLWGRHFRGRAGGLLTGGVTAIWTDLVYYAPHSLSETLATYVLLPALLMTYPATRITSARALGGGLLFGTAFMLRVQLGPAVALAAIAFCWRRSPREWRRFSMGFLIPVILSGGLDWITYGQPFHDSIVYFKVNFLDGVSADFGVAPWYEIFQMPEQLWGPVGSTVILALAVCGAFRLPLLFAIAAAIFLTHAIVPHKEFRFIFPAFPLLLILCGIATADICFFLCRHVGKYLARPAVLGAAFALWCCLSVSVALSPLERYFWSRGAGDIDIMRVAASGPPLCGIGLLNMKLWELPGGAASPVDVPIYQTSAAGLARESAGFDAILAGKRNGPANPQFVRIACFPHASYYPDSSPRSICLWRRPGPCISGVARLPATNWPPSFRHAG